MSNPNNFNASVIEEFRANGGKVGGPFANTPLILLTTKGAKSGKPRVSPLAHFDDIAGDGRIVIIASKGGAPSNPDWYHNILANPVVTVETGRETFQARAIIPDRQERDRLFSQVVARAPGFGEYQRKTSRVIPVVVLERIEGAAN